MAENTHKRQLGGYKLLKKLGQGAMGAVYLARRTSDDLKVALKVLPPELARDKEFLERFRREARATEKLRHPNIVGAHEVGSCDGYHFIAMEYVEGFDLEEGFKHQPNGRYAPEVVLRVARDMALALETARAHGVVHRDLKPANILQGEDGTYKLTDLGLAARVLEDERVTQTGLAVGTPFYISPEQAQARPDVDGRADIYSLGATLYHLATGKLPFEDENPVIVMTKHVRETPTPPQELVPDLPKGLCRLIEKMMAKPPQDRHQTPRELLGDIARIRSGGVPLLKRARTKARPENVPRDLKPSSASLDSLPRPSAPPPPVRAVSRWPAGPSRESPAGGVPKARNIPREYIYVLFFGGLFVAAIVAGLLLSRL